jgi:hypothetical protein
MIELAWDATAPAAPLAHSPLDAAAAAAAAPPSPQAQKQAQLHEACSAADAMADSLLALGEARGEQR